MTVVVVCFSISVPAGYYGAAGQGEGPGDVRQEQTHRGPTRHRHAGHQGEELPDVPADFQWSSYFIKRVCESEGDVFCPLTVMCLFLLLRVKWSFRRPSRSGSRKRT